MTNYPPPLDRLLTLGMPTNDRNRDYAGLGLDSQHVPDLIRMMQDKELNQADCNRAEVWAPMHAWRALAELNALEAAAPYLALLHELEDDDLIREDAPDFFTQLGPDTLPLLAAFLGDTHHNRYARWSAASAIAEIGNRFPGVRARCIEVLSAALTASSLEYAELNGGLVGALLDIGAEEAAPAIQAAFEADKIDPSIAGDWDEVGWELGATDKPPERAHYHPPMIRALTEREPLTPAQRAAKRKAKAKRETANKARKRNRKKR